MTHHMSSAPSHPSTHVARFERGSKFSIHGFRTPEAMRSLIEMVVQGDKYKWTDDNTIYVPELDLTISSEKLEEIMETTETVNLLAPYPSFAQSIRGEVIRQDDQPAPSSAVPASGSMTPADIARIKGTTPSAVRRKLRKLNLTAPFSAEVLKYF